MADLSNLLRIKGVRETLQEKAKREANAHIFELVEQTKGKFSNPENIRIVDEMLEKIYFDSYLRQLGAEGTKETASAKAYLNLDL
ncbi:hypothetical protein HYX16_03165 [Candidatus Woesearchaeota archaeon]|nr:hypothetical protein [Candidatus Woesearchaeota archaeon]